METAIVLGPAATLQIERGSVFLRHGGFYIRSKDTTIRFDGADAHLNGEAFFSIEKPQQAFVRVFAGQVSVGTEPHSIVTQDQSAQLTPFRLATHPVIQPAWGPRALELLHAQK